MAGSWLRHEQKAQACHVNDLFNEENIHHPIPGGKMKINKQTHQLVLIHPLGICF
jgi:hypothetical protein